MDVRLALNRSALAILGALIVAVGLLTVGVRAASAAYPGQICLTANQASVYERLDGPGWVYTLPQGAGFKIVDYFSTGGLDYYYGHGNGQPDGFILRSSINQSTCVWP